MTDTLTSIHGGRPSWKSPPNLTEPAALALFQDCLETVSTRDTVLSADVSIAGSAAFALQNEMELHALAEQARSEGQHIAAVKLCAMADKSSHSKARHLSRLMLTGERRFRRDKQHQKQAAAHQHQITSDDNDWADIL